MRYLLLLTTDASAPAEMLQRYTVELIRAGVLLAGELLASDDGAHIQLALNGPRTDADLQPVSPVRPVALWIVQTADRAEAVEWARRVPLGRGRVEVRRILTGAGAT
ncbi:YciI family protein [Leifsonia sp. EB34]|uniref:YciI family protein n=1 Tax=Leifsonia sp. EB34 TaxID=3156303 RepID=UPI0035113735